jgi:hypothetical protein
MALLAAELAINLSLYRNLPFDLQVRPRLPPAHYPGNMRAW